MIVAIIVVICLIFVGLLCLGFYIKGDIFNE